VYLSDTAYWKNVPALDENYRGVKAHTYAWPAAAQP
jgi:hypothetical protein